MNFFKRSLLSLKRRPGKSVTLLVLLCILCNVIAGAVSVKTALEETNQALVGGMAPNATIELDYSQFMSGEYVDVGTLDVETIEKLGQATQVKNYDYTQSLYVTQKENYFELKGVSKSQFADLRAGKISVVEGRNLTEEEFASGAPMILISDAIAKEQELSIGSKVKVNVQVFQYDEQEILREGEIQQNTAMTFGDMIEVEQEFEVVGIFEGKKSVSMDKEGKVVEHPSPLNNTLYTSNQGIEQYKEIIVNAEGNTMGENSVYTDLQANFELNSSKELELFKAENKSLLPTGYGFADDSKQYAQAAAPMENMKWVANIVMWAAVVATILIISLLVTLFLRDRKHEMGIYLSLGHKKITIAGQILSEVLLIAVVAVTISIFSGNMIAKSMSTSLLQTQIDAIKKESLEEIPSFGAGIIVGSATTGETIGNESKLDELTEEIMTMYSVQLDFETILLIYVIGLGSVLISTIIPITYTLRLKPRKILM